MSKETTGPAEAEPKAKPQPVAEAKAETKSPREWFAALKPPGETKEAAHVRLTVHQSAATMHGWKLHRHHSGGTAIQLTRSAYEGALVGAASGLGRPAIHRPALSPYKKTKG